MRQRACRVGTSYLRMDQNLSYVLLSVSPDTALAVLAAATWTAGQDMHGEIPADIVGSVLRAKSPRGLQRMLSELSTAHYHHGALMILAGDTYKLNESFFRFQRDGQDWDRSETHKVIARDGKFCRYCGCECFQDLSFDHVFPRSRGGGDKPHNLVVCCVSCNSRKSDRTPEEAGMILLPVPSKRVAAS